MHLLSDIFTKFVGQFCNLQSGPHIVITNPPIEVREEVNKQLKEKEELEKKFEEIRLK